MVSKLYNTLQGRLTLALFASFFVVGIFAAYLLVSSSRAYQREVTQLMYSNLAGHVIDNYLPFTESGEPDLFAAKNTFNNLMVLGPNFEFYLLDAEGNIVSCTAPIEELARDSVDIAPIERYLNETRVQEAILGDDPRAADREKIFSVAPIYKDGETKGYLYVILGSEIYDQTAARVWESKIIQWGLWAFGSGLLFALIATLWLTGLITRPLTQLTRQVSIIREKGFPRDSSEDNDVIRALDQWSESNTNEIHSLALTFKQALETIGEQYQNIVTIDELRKELLSHVSHDLRTPLATLLGYLETWEINQDQLTREQSQQYIATAKKSAQRISSLVEQLFELAYLDSNNVQVHKEPFSIAELVQDVLQKFHIEAEKRNIVLDVTPKDSSITVLGDIEKLERVFINLIENALRHSNDFGRVTVRLNNNGGLVAVEVADTGIGIPSEDLPNIFDPHYKAGNSVRGNSAHGGLGLAITKRLLELHQANIRVESQIDQGTTFQFNLPAA